jgi:hypothetical protein
LIDAAETGLRRSPDCAESGGEIHAYGAGREAPIASSCKAEKSTAIQSARRRAATAIPGWHKIGRIWKTRSERSYLNTVAVETTAVQWQLRLLLSSHPVVRQN